MSTLTPQSKAVLIEVPGKATMAEDGCTLVIEPPVAMIIRTKDGRAVVMTPDLAVDIARRILGSSGGLIPADPQPARGGLVQ